MGSKYPKIAKSWKDNWANLATYFKYPDLSFFIGSVVLKKNGHQSIRSIIPSIFQHIRGVQQCFLQRLIRHLSQSRLILRPQLRAQAGHLIPGTPNQQIAQVTTILVPIPNGIWVVTGLYLRAANTAAVPQIRFLHESTTLCSVSGTISYSSAQGKRGSFRCPSCCYNFMENQN